MPTSDNKTPSVISYFQMTDEQIRFVKGQQLRITHYSLLVQAALIYLYTSLLRRYEFLFIIVSILVAIYVMGFIIKSQCDMMDYRKRQEKLRHYFAPIELKFLLDDNNSFYKEDIYKNDKLKVENISFFEDKFYIIAYFLVTIIGMVFALLVFCSRFRLCY